MSWPGKRLLTTDATPDMSVSAQPLTTLLRSRAHACNKFQARRAGLAVVKFCLRVRPFSVTCQAATHSPPRILRQSFRGQIDTHPAIELAARLEQALRERSLPEFLAAAQACSLPLGAVSGIPEHDLWLKHDVEQQFHRFLSLAVEMRRVDQALALLQFLPADIRLWTSLLKEVSAKGNLQQLQHILQVRLRGRRFMPLARVSSYSRKCSES